MFVVNKNSLLYLEVNTPSINVKRIQNHFDIYELNARGKEQILAENLNFNSANFRKGYNLHNEEGEYIGTIQKHDAEAKTLIILDQSGQSGKKPKPKLVHYRKAVTPHFSFSHYSPEYL